jgi:hypothetical protein
MLLSVGPDIPEPELPTVRMKTATGYQNRQAKPGDKEYVQYQKDKTAYDKEVFDLRVAIGAVMALRDIDWSKYDLSNPPPVASAQEMYNGCWPDNELLRKKAWLDWTVLSKRRDQSVILEAMSKMNGEAEPTEEMIEEVKKNSVSSSKRVGEKDNSYTIKSQNTMWWRGANAALKAGKLDIWPYLPAWHKAYIIATVEEDILIHNVLNG